jgi:hypothetical protein
MPPNYIKDPAALLPYSWDWTAWLAGAGDTISSATVLVPEGLTAVGSANVDGTVVTQRVSGGSSGAIYKMVCQITTAGGLIDERSIQLTVMDR